MTDLETLAKRYRLGETLYFHPDEEYKEDVLSQIENMKDKPRAKGRDEKALAHNLLKSRALEYCLQRNVSGLEMIPFGSQGKKGGADIDDTLTGYKIDVKKQSCRLETWEFLPEDLKNLFETFRRGNVDFVITGDCGYVDNSTREVFSGVFFQLIPISLIFHGFPANPHQEVDDVVPWLNEDWVWKSTKKNAKPGQRFFRNHIASESGASVWIEKSYHGKRIAA